MRLTDSDDDIRRAVLDEYIAMHPRDRNWNSRWVMSQEWLDRLQAIGPHVAPVPRLLHSRPITVTPHASEPRLIKVVNRA